MFRPFKAIYFSFFYQGKFVECYDAVDELYNIKGALYGDESEEVIKDLETFQKLRIF